MYVNYSSYYNDWGVGLYLVTKLGEERYYSVKLTFEAAKNKVEYESLLVGHNIAKELGASIVDMYVDP